MKLTTLIHLNSLMFIYTLISSKHEEIKKNEVTALINLNFLMFQLIQHHAPIRNQFN